MMRLYDSPVSGNCYKVRLLLSHLGISYQRIEVDVVLREDRVQQLGGKNPIAKIPILELNDGRFLGESNAILWYLADGTKFLAPDPYVRARVLQWMFFEQNNHEPNIAMARHWMFIQKKKDMDQNALEQKHEAGNIALGVMERYLEDHSFFVDESYSVADMALYAYTHVAPEGGFDLQPYPAVRTWLSRVAEQPDFIRMMD